MWDDIKNILTDIIIENGITNIITVSWKYMLPTNINNILSTPIIVLHDSLLPKYRGFAPTPTAIICGENKFGVTALFATDDVDKGDIIKQKSVYISNDKYIADVIEILSDLYEDIVCEIIEDLKNNNIVAYPQNENLATYSIWRNIEDCHINWKKDSNYIYNFIRAIGTPYYGAFSFLDGEKIIINKAEVLKNDLNFALRDEGKIWKIENGCPEVICGKGMLKIKEAVYEKDRNIKVIFKKVRSRLY